MPILKILFLNIDFSLIWKEIRNKEYKKDMNITFRRMEVGKRFDIIAAFFFFNVTLNYFGRKGIVSVVFSEC